MPRKKKVRAGSHTIDIERTWTLHRPDLDPADYQFLIHLNRVGRMLGRVGEKYSLDRFGLSVTDVAVLLALRRMGAEAPRAIDLSHDMVMTLSAITKKVDRLEARGLVRRAPGPGPDEIVILATPAGTALADTAITEMVEGSPVSAAQGPLTRDERQELARLCRKMLIDLEQRLGEV